MQPDNSVVDELVQRIVAAVHPLRVVVFGSAVRGEAEPDSDIDILVVMPEGTHRRRTAQYLYRSISGIKIPFDLIVATPSDLDRHKDNANLIYRGILREGKTVYAA